MSFRVQREFSDKQKEQNAVLNNKKKDTCVVEYTFGTDLTKVEFI